MKVYLNADPEKAKVVKALIDEFMKSLFNIEPGVDIPYSEKLDVQVDQQENREVVYDSFNNQRFAVIDFPSSCDQQTKDEYKERFIDTAKVLDKNEMDLTVKEMRQFERQHGISRLVIPDEQPPAWGSRAGIDPSS